MGRKLRSELSSGSGMKVNVCKKLQQNQMYNAYCLEEIVSKLPIEALSISNHGKN